MPTSREEMERRGLTPHETNHNQHRRAEWRDYAAVGLYMVTLCIEGRRPLFGELAGRARAARDTSDFPHIVLSPLGLAIRDEELPKIHRFYPEIELWQAAIMPDHLHLLLYISAPLPAGKHLGHIINSFKGGCSRAWWALMDSREKALEQTGANAPGTTAPASVSFATPAVVPAASAAVPFHPSLSPASSSASASSLTSTLAPAVVPAASAAVPFRPSLFEPGYHDRIISRPGMLENIKRYIADNPLRAVMRRELPRLMERRLHLRIGNHDYAAFGGLFLVKRPEKEQVFFHRRDKQTGAPIETTPWYATQRQQLLEEASEGVVLVSPSISRGERLVIDAAIDAGLPVIHLQKEPITRYWKPERRRFEACARGTLLILAPWGLDEEIAAGMSTTAASTGISDYARFHRLNDLAAEICATTEVTLLNVEEIMKG